jgi:pilus assembly protein Flp/PilA
MLRGVAPQEKMPIGKTGWRDGKGTEAAAVAVGNVNHVAGEGEGVMKELLARFVREDEGQDIIEYALLGGLITALVVVLIDTIGTNVQTLYTNLSTAVATAVAP